MKYKTDINIVLDRSGSMQGIKADTIGGFNQFLKEQKQSPENARISLYQFDATTDDWYQTVYADRNIVEAPELNDTTFVPRGGTALLDAVGRTINSVGARLSAMKPEDRPSQILVAIITDGQENSSREYNKAKIEEMVKHQTDVYKWQFVYIGANLDAIHAGSTYGSFSSQQNYAMASAGGQVGTAGGLVYNSFKGLSASTLNYRSQSSGCVPDFLALDSTSDDERVRQIKQETGKTVV